MCFPYESWPRSKRVSNCEQWRTRTIRDDFGRDYFLCGSSMPLYFVSLMTPAPDRVGMSGQMGIPIIICFLFLIIDMLTLHFPKNNNLHLSNYLTFNVFGLYSVCNCCFCYLYSFFVSLFFISVQSNVFSRFLDMKTHFTITTIIITLLKHQCR